MSDGQHEEPSPLGVECLMCGAQPGEKCVGRLVGRVWSETFTISRLGVHGELPEAHMGRRRHALDRWKAANPGPGGSTTQTEERR